MVGVVLHFILKNTGSFVSQYASGETPKKLH